MPINNTLWQLAALVKREVSFSKRYKGRYLTAKLQDGRSFCFKD